MNRKDPHCDAVSDGVLLRYQDGELPAAERSQVCGHLEECPECRERLGRLRAVSSVLAGYAKLLGDAGDQPAAAAALADALRDRPAPARQGIFASYWWRPVPAFAAVLMLGAVLVSRWPARNATRVLTFPPAIQAPADPLGNGFIALPYSDQNLSAEGAVVIEVEVPRSALLLAGETVSDTETTGRVRAELVVGADGLARAIRFLN